MWRLVSREFMLWAARVLFCILAAVLAWMILSGCAVPKQHNSPDRAKLENAMVRVAKAIPVLRATQAKLGEAVRKTSEGNAATRAAHVEQVAIIEALPQHVERLRASASDVELREGLDALDATVRQLQTSSLTTTTLFRSSEGDIARLQSELAAHGAAIAEIVQANQQVRAEGEALLVQYEQRLADFNALEITHADTKNALTKMKIKSGFATAWQWVSGLGAGALAILFAVGKLGLK